MDKLIFPITSVDQGLELRLSEDAPEVIAVDRATGKQTVYSADSDELAVLVQEAQKLTDTHVVDLPETDRKVEVTFTHDGSAILVSYKLEDGVEGNANLYQIVGQTEHLDYAYAHRDAAYQARLDETDWRAPNAVLDLGSHDDLKALLSRVATWVAWHNGIGPAFASDQPTGP